MPESRSSLGWRATSAPSSAHLISRPSAVSSPSCVGLDREARRRGGQRRVDRAAVGDVHLDRPCAVSTGTPRASTYAGTLRNVTAATAPPAGARARRPGPTARRSTARASPSAGAATPAGLHRPHAERDRAVAAGGREAVLVPEQHAEVRALVVGRDEEAAVHVGVPARLVAEQPPDPLGPGSTAPRSRRSATVAPGSSGRRRARSGTALRPCGSRSCAPPRAGR